ncbi:MAG: carbonic anhydrase [Vicinamibacterales bacterium]
MNRTALVTAAALVTTIGAMTLGVGAEHQATDPLTRLMDGNKRFVSGTVERPHQDRSSREALAKGQKPFAMLVSCADSRVPPEILFDQGLGDLFVVRAAGNIADSIALGSLEYGHAVLGANLLVVLGHEYCGAVDATVKGHDVPGHIAEVVRHIKPAVEKSKGEIDMLNAAIDHNVRDVAKGLRERSEILKASVDTGKLRIVGARYDLDSGEVTLVPQSGTRSTLN